MPTSKCDAVGVDVAVVGAGPAGMAAAVTAADAGATVALIDAEPRLGGQFWRHPGQSDGGPGAVADTEVANLHHDLRTYRELMCRIENHRATDRIIYLPGHQVWSLERNDSAGLDSNGQQNPGGGGPAETGFAVHAFVERGAGKTGITVLARTVVLAPGAYDLQVPFPGWDLPGVMTAGGVQSLLKGHGVLAGRRILVAGTGPFLLSVAAGIARSGGRVLGVHEAASPAGWRTGIGAVLVNPEKLREGAGYAGALARHRVRYHSRSTVLEAQGTDRLESVTVAPLDRSGRPIAGKARRVEVDVLAVGWGFAPQLELPLALGCATVVGAGGIPVIGVDGDQRSSVHGVYIAGEACGIGGAALAVVEGEIAGAAAGWSALRAAGRSVARSEGQPVAEIPSVAVRTTNTPPVRGIRLMGIRLIRPAGRRDQEDQRDEQELGPYVHSPDLKGLRRRRERLRAFASAMARAYPVPSHWIDGLRGDTVICRCEEVTTAAIREVVDRDGATDARTAKLLVRPGMGWCQGRVCGYATECLTSAWSGSPATHTAVARSVATPVPLGLVAGIPAAEPGSAAD